VPPDIFIALAERSGLLSVLDMTVIQRAVTLIDLMPGGSQPPVLTVNVGLSHLPDDRLVPSLLDLLAQQDIAAHRLVIEIPEDRSIEDPAVLRTLTGLRAAGVRLALDDFGVGYSSLGYLTTFRFDEVKIDKSFVKKLDRIESRAVISSIVQLSQSLNLTTVVEGIETAEQLATVRPLGIELAQGYLFGSPVPFGELDFQTRSLPGASAAA
jgi:EAL domain-containing protein (putative c-di-GMP-specific phosphodiesterase class I)